MTLEAQVVGTQGRLQGDPQLIGSRGRIPYDVAADAGKATLTEGGAVATLNEGGATATLTEGGATMTLTEEFC